MLHRGRSSRRSARGEPESHFEPEVKGDLIFAWALKLGVRHLCKVT
jgi:hypothetical protein